MRRSVKQAAQLAAATICMSAFYAYALLPTSAARHSLFFTQSSSDLTAFFIGAQSGIFITSLLAFIIAAFAQKIPRMRWLSCVGIVGGPIAIAVFTNLAASPGTVLSIVLGAVYGAGQVPLFVLWFSCLGRFGTPRDLIILCAAFPLSELISWAVMSIGDVASTVILIAAAVCAGVPMLIRLFREPADRTERDQQHAPGVAGSASHAKMVVTGPTLGLALFVFISSTVNFPFGTAGSEATVMTLVGMLFIALIGGICYHRNVTYIFTQIILPLAAVVLLVLRLLPDMMDVSDSVYIDFNQVCFAVVEVLSLYYVVHCMRASEQRPNLIIFAFMGMLSCAALIGIAMQSLSMDTCAIVIEVVTVIFMIYIAGWFIIKAVRSRTSSYPGYHLPDLAAFGRERGLSQREIDVLELYGRGYSAPYIAEKLFLSVNTVRNHIRSIYMKLGISSHDELLELLESSNANDSDLI